MAKSPTAEKKETPSTEKPTTGAPQGGEAHQGPKHGHGGGSSGAKAKGHEPIPGSCFAVGCKTKPARFNFCDEHYDQFKFGLIKKTGELVSDHEKKIEHYEAYKARKAAAARTVRKVA